MKNQQPISISLYEFYTMCMANLRDKAPWEKSPKITKYHQSYVAEERLLALAVLFLIGEIYIPSEVLKTMPAKYREQVSDSVNKAVFARALKHFYRNQPDPAVLANDAMHKMDSYILTIRKSQHNNEDPIDSVTYTLAKRIPPQDKKQLENYENSVDQIMDYLSKLTGKKFMQAYKITEL